MRVTQPGYNSRLLIICFDHMSAVLRAGSQRAVTTLQSPSSSPVSAAGCTTYGAPVRDKVNLSLCRRGIDRDLDALRCSLDLLSSLLPLEFLVLAPDCTEEPNPCSRMEEERLACELD